MDEFEKEERRWRKRRIFRPHRHRSQRSWLLTALLVAAVLFMVAALPEVDDVVVSWIGWGD